jgi:glutathione synthase/RimK-type ligase-like ATP-grasp enzyme
MRFQLVQATCERKGRRLVAKRVAGNFGGTIFVIDKKKRGELTKLYKNKMKKRNNFTLVTF